MKKTVTVLSLFITFYAMTAKCDLKCLIQPLSQKTDSPLVTIKSRDSVNKPFELSNGITIRIDYMYAGKAIDIWASKDNNEIYSSTINSDSTIYDYDVKFDDVFIHCHP